MHVSESPRKFACAPSEEACVSESLTGLIDGNSEIICLQHRKLAPGEKVGQCKFRD